MISTRLRRVGRRWLTILYAEEAAFADAAGNITTGHRGWDYVYDAENRLVKVKRVDDTTLSLNYYYADGTMRAATGMGRMYYDGDQEIAAYDDPWPVGGADAELLRRYIRLPGSVDEVLLMIDYTLDDCSSSYAACEVWAHHDRLGSTVKTSDSMGNEIDSYTYSKFGESGPEGDSGFPFRFTGQKLDPVTGLYYYKARWYDPETGRFLQTDPIGYSDGMNMYAYVGNDPANGTDSTGLSLDDDDNDAPPDIEDHGPRGPIEVEDQIIVTGTRNTCGVGSACFANRLAGIGLRGMGGRSAANPLYIQLFANEGDSRPYNGARDDDEGGNWKKRKLTREEKALIPKCIARNVNLDRVVIKNARSFGAGNNIVTRGYRIYWPGAPQNIANSSLSNQWLLVHEVTHVWQYKSLGYTVFSFTGRNYTYELDEHDNLRDFDAEQMASIVADYFLRGRGYSAMKNIGGNNSLMAYSNLVDNCMRK